jgi:competence protein ComEA
MAESWKPRRHLIAYALALAAVLVFGARQLMQSGGSSAAASVPIEVARGTSSADGGTARGGTVVVDVAGAVRRPGVYRLRAGARVADALRRAGGATRHAELSGINRAMKLEDGRQILVPKRAVAGVPAAAATAAVPGVPAPPVNLNTATSEQLEGLDGIGPAMAKKILDYRTAHGGFSRIDELGEISGIGERRLASLREQVTL